MLLLLFALSGIWFVQYVIEQSKHFGDLWGGCFTFMDLDNYPF